MKQMTRLLDLIDGRRWVTNAEIDAALHPDGSPVARKLRHVLVCRARRALAPEGKYINSIYGIGYRIESTPQNVRPGSTPLDPVRISARRP